MLLKTLQCLTKYFLKEKGIKFVTSHKNREKSYTQINGEIALCEKRNQQFNWHGDFVYHPVADNEVFEENFNDFIFDVKGNFKYSYVPLWTLFPALYPIYVYINADLGARFVNIGGSAKYAYFFLDKDKIGIEGVVGYLALMWVIYEMCCLAFVFIDGAIKRHKKKRI